MPVIRLFLLLLVLTALTLLVVQNLSPVLGLVFLGARSQALPLSVWILFSVGAGVLTSLAIALLFKISPYFAPKPNRRDYVAATPPKQTHRNEPSTNRSQQPQAQTSNDTADDWDAENTSDDDWDFDEDDPPSPPPQDSVRDSTTYERQQEPKSGSKSGSVYSYSYKEPKNTAAGKTESVYDADYRVIVPPYQNPNKAQDDDEDWGFDDDDDFDQDDAERPRR